MCAKCEGWRRGGTWHRTAARSTHNGSSGRAQLAAPLQRMQPPRARHLSIGWKHALSFRWRTYQLHLVVHLVHVVQGDLDAGPAGRGAGCGSVRGGVGPDHRGGRLEEVEGCRGEGVVEPTVRSVCGACAEQRDGQGDGRGTRWTGVRRMRWTGTSGACAKRSGANGGGPRRVFKGGGVDAEGQQDQGVGVD